MSGIEAPDNQKNSRKSHWIPHNSSAVLILLDPPQLIVVKASRNSSPLSRPINIHFFTFRVHHEPEERRADFTGGRRGRSGEKAEKAVGECASGVWLTVWASRQGGGDGGCGCALCCRAKSRGRRRRIPWCLVRLLGRGGERDDPKASTGTRTRTGRVPPAASKHTRNPYKEKNRE